MWGRSFCCLDHQQSWNWLLSNIHSSSRYQAKAAGQGQPPAPSGAVAGAQQQQQQQAMTGSSQWLPQSNRL